MQRPAPNEYAEYYAGYIARVPEGPIVDLLERQIGETAQLFRSVPPAKATYRYAPGKWSVIDVLGHLSDTERVLSYRALAVARADTTSLPPFDEDHYVANAGFEWRTIADVLQEFEAVRRATVSLFRSLSPDAWTRQGTASGHTISVRALAYIIAGHERHHVAILHERYGI